MSEIKTTLTRLASPLAGPRVLDAYHDLMVKKLHNGRFDLRPDKHVLLLDHSKNGRDWEHAAVAMFMLASEQRVLWVDLVYVVEAFRGQGMCRRLFQHMRSLAEQNEMLAIQYGTSLANSAMRGAAKRLGHNEESIVIIAPIATAE